MSKARVRLFLYFLNLGYCYTAAWQQADRQMAFKRRHRHANG